jgi:class 3 adenylate cyclase
VTPASIGSRRWTLRFDDPAVEAEFQADLARARRRELQLGAVVLVALYAAFGPVDVWLYPQSATALLVLRFGVVVPLLVLALPLLFLERLRATFERRPQETLLYLGLVATGGVVVMGTCIQREMTQTQLIVGAAGEMVALSFMYGFTQLRFTFAAGLGIGSTLAGLACAVLVVRPPAEILFPLCLFAVALNAGGLFVVRSLEALARSDFEARREIAAERARSEALLSNALPAHVAARLHERDDEPERERAALAERYDEITVLIADLVGFTPLSERLGEAELARFLHRLYARFDGLGARHGVEKIKTLGDAWIAAAGGPVPADDHADRVARLARDLLAAMAELREDLAGSVQVRIGIHTGSAVGGVIGRTRFAYDLWGEAVEGAKRMEAGGAPGRARLSPAAAAALRDPDALELELETRADGSTVRWMGPGEPPPPSEWRAPGRT